MVKGQYFVIEAIIAGIILIAVISSVFFFGTTKTDTEYVSILDNYCQDSLQMLIKQDLLKNQGEAINELNKLIPGSLTYCLRINDVEINRQCSKLRKNAISCRGLYAYYTYEYVISEVQLSLS